NLGDYVDVVINKVNSTEKMLLVPFSSIISLGQGDYSIFVVKDGIAKTRQVKIGSQNSTQVQILSGVKEGEKVVISGTLDLQDGDKIEEEK
ncbi:efflux RND transporter periplasmic adaptor subunit, partial [Candidatus Gracilibacteria bacterium]|nr:efflux RND transporter periplasmic adaptor subunit [Candidatus Gracilibacteria bacterium]